MNLATWLWLIFTLGAISGSIYALFAAVLLRRFGQKPTISAPSSPDLTVLKPLYGAEPGLEANLASFCEQDYQGNIQLLFGIHSAEDPAGQVVEQLRRRFPDRDIELIADEHEHGQNPKISNLLNMLPRARYKLIVMADSDIRVAPDYLNEVVSALSAPDVGVVTALYRGFPVAGLWSRLSATSINEHFLPSVLVGLELGLAKPCFGATIALSTGTLQRIGGLGAFADKLADDYAIGEAARDLGLKVAIAPMLVGHACTEQSFGELLRHDLRWARTLRLIEPFRYAGLILTHPLPLAIIAAALNGFGLSGWAIISLALACRLSIPIQLRAVPNGGDGSLLLSPVRDLLSFAVFLLSFLPGPVSWRGREYRAGSGGR
ncbi:MAG TPA: bacteriohopanetetrol glucosamine biosynthesis glycosyltransferase HpnI [Methyloceanibacter sp.]